MSLQFNVTLPRRHFELRLQGEFLNGTVGIFGPSGAGKTSFFHLLTGLERPRQGHIILNGRVLTDTEQKIHVPPNKRRIGVVFQEKRLFPHLTVRDNILFGERYVTTKRVTLDRVAELLDLTRLLDSYPGSISGGEQQRTAIARALLTSPELILLDEPFNAVDTTLRQTFLPYLRRVRDELQIPMLVISHDLPDIQRLTSQLYLIDRGLCTGYGDIITLFSEKDSLPGDIGLTNSFTLINPRKIHEDLYECSIEGSSTNSVKVPFAPREKFTVALLPSEIALSRRALAYTSIQNQLHGRVTKIIHKQHYVYCLVDCGVPILTKITRDSEERLALQTGSEIYCLFKAQTLSL